MQNDLDRETVSLQELEAQKQEAQDRLEEMDQQKHKLEDMLNEIRIKCQEESQMVRKGKNGMGGLLRLKFQPLAFLGQTLLYFRFVRLNAI